MTLQSSLPVTAHFQLLEPRLCNSLPVHLVNDNILSKTEILFILASSIVIIDLELYFYLIYSK